MLSLRTGVRQGGGDALPQTACSPTSMPRALSCIGEILRPIFTCGDPWPPRAPSPNYNVPKTTKTTLVAGDRDQGPACPWYALGDKLRLGWRSRTRTGGVAHVYSSVLPFRRNPIPPRCPAWSRHTGQDGSGTRCARPRALRACMLALPWLPLRGALDDGQIKDPRAAMAVAARQGRHTPFPAAGPPPVSSLSSRGPRLAKYLEERSSWRALLFSLT
ncbi:hypothetical protein PCL_05320 [Purpureocillium lilacinum]|uniref:Uncharacterized protein n=1 Tax=Purpureocillium lilacinum TaxID=33203 RepID=A0A2U3DV25_PURLI|nr:hypothetical protein PCL_05320 [Purpureocillium lilacinum]